VGDEAIDRGESLKAAAPWLGLLLVIMVAGGVFLWRMRLSTPVPGANAETIIRQAWGPGRRVPLRGLETIEVTGANGKPVRLEARVLTSGEGSVRIEYLTPPLKGVTVWETGDRTYRYNPKLRRLSVARPRVSPEDQAEEAAQLLRNYTARVLREETVAGHPARVVELRPRQASGRHRLVWVDRNTSVILASVEHEEQGGRDEVLRSTRFSHVEYLQPGQAPGPEQFRPPAELIEKYGSAHRGDTSSRFEPPTLSRLIGFPVRVPAWVPPGYTFKAAYQTPCPCDRQHPAARLEWSDGLNTLSLFQCGHPGHEASGACLSSERAGSLAVARLQKIGGVDWYFLAVGVVPGKDLQAIVDSVSKP